MRACDKMNIEGKIANTAKAKMLNLHIRDRPEQNGSRKLLYAHWNLCIVKMNSLVIASGSKASQSKSRPP